ncbi:MAG: ABC transporter ATP-binding protein [Bacteroidota bacterium]
MIKNLLYAFRYDPKGMKQAFFWEWLHGFCLAVPSGILLVIIWELFRTEPDVQKIKWTIGLMLILFFAQLFIANRAMLASNFATTEISRKLRLALGNKLQRLSLGYYKSRDPGDLAAIVLQDVTNFENIFGHSVPNIANAIFGVSILSCFLFYLDWRLTLTLLIAIALALPLIQLSRWLISRLGAKHIIARNQTGARFLEYVQGIQHIRSYGMTGTRFTSLDQALTDLRRESIKVEAIPGPVILMIGVIFELFFILMIWLALYFMVEGSLTIPILIAFLIVGYRLYEPLKILMVENPVLSYMNISLNRIITVLEAKEQSIGQDLRPQDYSIVFKDVHFSYLEGKKVLDGISFTAPAATMTALVGASGSGKTTITALIARFWDISQGSIAIGGIDIREMAPQTVYALISEVFQEVYLFDDSIYQNIQIGNPQANESQVLEAARQAQVMEFVEVLPDGLQTRVGEGGSQLSGGQKQRISIARALLKDAPIVLLDEATASLDPENEIYIQKAIQALVKNKTVIVIAHKLSTIQQADRILVLKEGSIVEAGQHSGLLTKDGLYAKMWAMQQRAHGWKIVDSTIYKGPAPKRSQSPTNTSTQLIHPPKT